MCRLADLHVLCAQIHRWQSMIAIGDELHDRYPQLSPALTGLDGGADLIQADIRIRRQLLDADIYRRTADFTAIPDRIRRRWRATTDDLLPAAYLSVTGGCACGGSGAAWVGVAGVGVTGVRGSRCGRIGGHGGLHDGVPPRAQGAGFGPVHHAGVVGIGCGGGYPVPGGARVRVAGGLGRMCGSHGDYRSRAVLGRN
ncbi:hypothetical protein [Nocardia sp. NPDC059228]|uniref:hypothetical protein n=1 Tax=Nocardia sp. NPDC059228 TaxID=3346777 RepID=UPI003677C4DA